MYICIEKFLGFTKGRTYEMTERGLLDDDGHHRHVICTGSRIIAEYFVKVEETFSLENK